jgi:hypothetical protein
MADSTRRGATGDAAEAGDPKQGGVGGAGVGVDQAMDWEPATPASREAAGAPAGPDEDRARDLTGDTELTGPGADAGVTSGSRATGTGANLGETEAVG